MYKQSLKATSSQIKLYLGPPSLKHNKSAIWVERSNFYCGRPLDKSKGKSELESEYLIVGFDTEFKTSDAPIRHSDLRLEDTQIKNLILSYQFSAKLGDFAWEGICCPKDGERITLGEFMVFVLGGGRKQNPKLVFPKKIYLVGHFTRADIPAFADFAEECFGLGYRAFKMHGWTDGDYRRDAATIRLLGKRVGDRMKLMHNSAGHLETFADALACGRACDESNFFWYEDPYADGGLAAHAHRRLRELIKTPILMGEHVRGVESMATLTLADGTDFVRADPDLDIGITGTMKIAHFAEALGLDVEIHGNGPAHRHAMAAIRNTNFYELGMVGPSRGQAVGSFYACNYSDDFEDVGKDGCFQTPDGPGLGVRYDWNFIKSHKISHMIFD